MSALSPAIYESIEISAETTNGSGKTIELNLGVVKINIFEACLLKQDSNNFE